MEDLKDDKPIKRKGKPSQSGGHKSHFPPGTSDDVRFSLKGEKKHGLDHFKTRKEIADNDLQKALGGDFPAPKLVDLDTANPTLLNIPDEKLRARVKTFLTVLLEGGIHRKAMAEGDFHWNHVNNLFHRTEGLKDLYIMCRDIGEDYRKIVRIDAAHERAVEGVLDPIYSPAGKFLGNRTLYSDRLLELLLKADNPIRFSKQLQVESEGTVIKISMGIDRDAFRKEAEEAEFEVLGGDDDG